MSIKQGIAENVGPARLTIVYERMGDSTAPAVLLIMGGGAQMINWPDGFCAELVGRGLQVIRFDNRDTGLSTHMNDAPVPDFAAAMKGDYATVSYTLSDMAADTVGLMDALDLAGAHLVGLSMGGMIAQTVAIEYPERVRSITCMMSTTGDSAVGQPDFATLAPLGTPPRDDRQAYIEWMIRSLKAIGSPAYPLDEAAVADRAGRSWDRDHDPQVMVRQAVAVLKSGDRTERLHDLRIPALVIHGDSDKMVNVSGGRATAAAIPGAKLVVIDGLGHGFPEALWGRFADLIAETVRKGERP